MYLELTSLLTLGCMKAMFNYRFISNVAYVKNAAHMNVCFH